MHSSRMCTDRGSSHLRGGGGRVCLPGGSAYGGSAFLGACLPGVVCLPGAGGGLPCHEGRPPCEQNTDRCKNIAFPHTLYVVSSKDAPRLGRPLRSDRKCGQTNTSENITFSQLRLRAVKFPIFRYWINCDRISIRFWIESMLDIVICIAPDSIN